MRKQITAAIVAVLLSATSVYAGSADKVRDIVAAEARAQGVPVALALAVASVESTFNCRAYNKGSIGLMQIKFRTARDIGYKGSPNGLYDCKTNAHFGVKYLKIALRKTGGNQCFAATLYNRGIYAKPRSSGYCRLVMKHKK